MSDVKQFVGFIIAEEHFGIDIMVVEEIINTIETTPVPRAPDFVEGIINMRGRVIPIVDLRKKLNMKNINLKKEHTSIIIIHVNGRRVGFIVDNVEEVIRIESDEINPAPGSTRAFDNYITGVARTSKGMVIIVDIMKLFTKQEQVELDSIKK